MTLDQKKYTELTELRQQVSELKQTNSALQVEVAECKARYKRAEEMLRERQDLLTFVIKYNPNAIAIFDKNLHYMQVSDCYRHDYGLGDQQVIGKHHYEVFPEIPQKWRDVHQRCLNGAIEGSDEDSFVREDGSITYNRWDCRPWYDARGNIGGITTFTEVITERKQAEIALRMAQFALDRAADGIHWLGPDGRHVYVNDAVCRNLGYTHEELRSMHVADIDPNFPLEAWEPTWHAVKQNGSMAFESLHRRKDGSTFPVDVSATFLEFNGKEYVCAVSRDITGRKQAEEELQTFKTMIENAPDGFALTDTQGNLRYANTTYYDTLGWDETLVGQPLEKTLAEDPERMATLAQHIVEQGVWQGELIHRRKDGSTFPGQASIFTMLDVNGQPQGWAGIVRDITERKQAEEEQQKLAAVIENSTDFIGMVTFEGQPLYLNEAGRRMVGIESDEEFLNTSMIEYVAPEDHDFFLQEALPVLQNEGYWRGEFSFQHFKTGEIIPVYYNAFLVKDSHSGQPLALAAIVRDISDQKRDEAERAALQEQIIQAQKAALRELSTPLLPIASGVLAMPLIGTIDSQRAQQILEALLEGVSTHQARIAIIDITGVQVMDTQIANTLIHAARAVKLLGAQVVLTGIQPGIAQTLVHLGADLGNLVTLSSLQRGIAYALNR